MHARMCFRKIVIIALQAVLQDIALKWRGTRDQSGHVIPEEQGKTWEMSEGPLLSATQKADIETMKIEVT